MEASQYPKNKSSFRPLFQQQNWKGPELFTRVAENPILEPTSRWWESKAVFNPGVVEDEEGIIHILYRAIGQDGISRLGYARSRDGVTIEERSAEPVFEPEEENEYEKLGVEDPRITALDDEYFVTYTAASLYGSPDLAPNGISPADPPWRARASLALTDDFDSFSRQGVILPDVDDKETVLFPEQIGGRYVLLRRLSPDIWITYSSDLQDWTDHRAVVRTRPGMWDGNRVGAGSPPVRIKEGWLLLYHGSDLNNIFRAGFALLDADDPGVVLARSEYPVLEPRERYETEGVRARVVFPEGLIRRGDELLMYYGGADRVVGVARGSLKEVLASLR